MNGTIFDLKEFAVHDGPGLRTTVFLKGCPLRCVWCHNPEGLSPLPQLMARKNGCRHCGLCERGCGHPDCQPYGRCLHVCPQGLLSVSGRSVSPDELAGRINKNSSLFGEHGGVTFSGGEPLMQAEFLHEVLDRIPEIPAAIETSGYAPTADFAGVISRMRLVYMDIKLADEKDHITYTGVSNRLILDNLEVLRYSGVPCVLRVPLIPGITDGEGNKSAIRVLAGELPVEWLPYNPLAGAKYPPLAMEYAYDNLKGDNNLI
ncbi:MAG: glycyl-radical enzyme activating protein [Eubacteriales bacterium]